MTETNYVIVPCKKHRWVVVKTITTGSTPSVASITTYCGDCGQTKPITKSIKELREEKINDTANTTKA